MFIHAGKGNLTGRQVRNVNTFSNRVGWIGTIVDEDATHILVRYDNQPEYYCQKRWPYTLQTYLKGREQRLQLLKKGY